MDREEAIEIIRKNMPSDKSLPVYEALQTLVPELAESEDERARKWLLDYAIEMIAGLESDISLSNYDGIKGHDPEAEAELAQWQKARAYLEKQKEQKEETLRDFIDSFPYSEKQEEQNPVVTHGETYHVDTLGTQQVIAGKMPQKSAEWSEEDEDNLRRVTRIIEDNDSDWKELTDWLKSLRPSWKPSEEQMEALKNSAYGSYQNGDGPRLRELYEQLKKLM